MMDGTPRSPEDRLHPVETSSLLGTHLHLLSRHQRQEKGERRAADPTRQSLRNPFVTSIPSIADIPAICRLGRHRFDLTQPEHGTAWLAQSVGRQRLSMARGATRIRVARRDGDLEAAAVLHVSGIDARWNLDVIAARDDGDDRAVDAVLRRAVQDAGRSGTRRLYARMPDFVNDEGALRRSGFVPYMTEHILRLRDEEEAPLGSSSQVRRIQPADVWGVHQLYLETVPRQVQYAEAVTSHAWDGSQPLRPGAKRASGWVLEEHGRICAFVQVSTIEHTGVARLDLLITPDRRRAAAHVIGPALREARFLHGVPCVAVIPGYEGELIQVLEDLNFACEGTQTAFVCYTTVSSRTHMIVVNHWAGAELPSTPAAVPGLGTARANATILREGVAGIHTWSGIGADR